MPDDVFELQQLRLLATAMLRMLDALEARRKAAAGAPELTGAPAARPTRIP